MVYCKFKSVIDEDEFYDNTGPKLFTVGLKHASYPMDIIFQANIIEKSEDSFTGKVSEYKYTPKWAKNKLKDTKLTDKKTVKEIEIKPDFGDLEVVRYDKSGPKIQERIPQVQGYLEQAKKFKSGDATCRGASFNFLRKATERLSKDVYMKGKGVSLPRRFERLDAEKMERLLVDSGIPTYPEIAGMRETFRFSGPPSHDDMTKNPPTPEELERHISRLETNWKKWI